MSQPEEALPVRTEAELVARSLDGDAEAFGELYARHAVATRAHVRRMLPGAPVDAEDAVQEAFVRAWCRLPQLRAAERFVPWLRAIAVAAARDRLRAARRELRLAEVPRADADPRGRDEAVAVRQAVAELPATQREAVALHYFGGLSTEEAGRQLGVPASTIHGRLQTGRKILRARLSRDREPAGGTPAPASLQAVVAAIRRRNVEGTHTLRGQPLVLFCGVPAEVEVVPSADEAAHVRGSVWAVGEDALAAISLRHDAVDDYWSVGPHAGQLFAGTRGEEGRPVAMTLSTAEWWAGVRDRVSANTGTVAAADAVSAALGQPCLRLSLVSSRVRGTWVGETDEASWRELARHLWPNSTGERGWHGPEARAALTVEVPAGATLVVATNRGMAGPVTATGVAAHLLCLGTAEITCEHHRGDLTLWQAPLDRVSGLEGRFAQYHADFGGGSWDKGRGGRQDPDVGLIEGATGAIDVTAARARLVLRRPGGAVRIDNRFGDTVIEVGSDIRGELTSLCGRIELRLPAGEPAPVIDAASPAGEVRWSGDLEADWGLRSWNTMEDLGLRAPGREPALRLRSEAGVVSLERVTAGSEGHGGGR